MAAQGRVEEVTDEPLYRDRVCGIDIGKAGQAAQVDGPALLSCGTPAEGGISIRGLRCHPAGGFLAVKKLIVLAALGLGAFAVWRKVQSDRAELDLWTEATAADEE